MQERKAGRLQSRTEYSFYKPPSVQHCQCIFIRLQTLHYPSSAESPPENRLSVMSNWVLKAAGFCGWSIRFSKTKLESSSFITGNETHSELWCSYTESITLPLSSSFPTLWNLKIDTVSQMVCTSSLPKSHNIYGMT